MRQTRPITAFNASLPDLTDVCGEGDLVDGGVQVDDVRRSLEGVKVGRQPLQGTQNQTLCVNKIPLHPTHQILDDLSPSFSGAPDP